MATKTSDQKWAARHPWLGTDPISTEYCTSPDIYEQEIEKVFKRSWLCVARAEELPDNGSHKLHRIDFASTNVLIIRGRDGEIRAFHNICTHRGNALVWPEGKTSYGKRSKLSCRFHAWTFTSEGELASVPQEERFGPCFDKAKNGLLPIHCETWEGFVFIHLGEQPDQPLREFLGGVADHFTGYPFHEVSRKFAFQADLNCNWKLGMDAFSEAYHVKSLHRNTLPGTFDTDLEDVEILGDHRVCSVYFSPPNAPPPVSGINFKRARASMTNAADQITGLPPQMNPKNRPDFGFDLAAFFPNYMVMAGEGLWFTVQFWPTGPDTCSWEGSYYTRPPTNHSERWAIEHGAIMHRDAWLEDTSTMENTQFSLNSGVLAEMHLQDEEVLVRHSYHVVEKYLKRPLRSKGIAV